MRGCCWQLSKRMLSSSVDLVERELSVQAPWGKIAVLTWGEAGRKPVLMLHGKIDSAAVFRPLVQMLPKQFYYVGIDFPGNGRSDALPKGVPLSVPDFVPTVKAVVDHFGLRRFAHISHSLGVHVGKFFHIAYPGCVEAAVELDPLPAYLTHEPDTLGAWYHYFYGSYFQQDAYRKFNAPAATAPVYTRRQALEMMKRNRDISEKAASIAIERTMEPAGEGLYRFTFDQRMKYVMRPPFSRQYLEELYTSMAMPILCVLAEKTIESGFFDLVPFVFDESKYGSGNYRVISVPGNHDVHLNHPERIADEVGRFLVKHVGTDSML